MIARFARLGIQQRIMLYVAVGLAIMFGSFAILGLRSIEQATELVYRERLSTAYTITGILERDFVHVARDVQEDSRGLSTADEQRSSIAARRALAHLSETDPFRFFHVTGLWVLDAKGQLVAEAGTPRFRANSETVAIVSAAVNAPASQFVVLSAVNGSVEGISFGTIAVRLADPAGSVSRVVAVHTVGANSTGPYVPTYDWASGSEGPPSSAPSENPQVKYHLEVVSPAGLVVLGVGEDEKPGTQSPHYPIIQRLVAERKAATLLHEPAAGNVFRPHVMAVVPLASSDFYLILEQPVDVALALPMQMQQGLLLLTSLGFLAALILAWITTRHVVKPTEQLTVAAQRMAQGDLESPINISAQDEVGKLAESLDTMRQKLQAAYYQLENANKELESQVKERTSRLGELLRKIISAQEEERYRLARELHDETAQTLGALSISLDRARDSLESSRPHTMEQILEAKAIATRLLEETRRLILDLRPLVLDDLGLGPAIRWYAETHLDEQGVAATVEVDQPATRLPKHVEISLFRVIQEAVNNIAKHAQARQAHIRLTFRGSVATAVIADDGKGFDADRVLGSGAPVESVGLLGMQERVRLLNGRIRICSQEGRGTEVAVEIPVAEVSA